MQHYWNIYLYTPGRGAKLIFYIKVRNYLINLKFSIFYDPAIYFQAYILEQFKETLFKKGDNYKHVRHL